LLQPISFVLATGLLGCLAAAFLAGALIIFFAIMMPCIAEDTKACAEMPTLPVVGHAGTAAVVIVTIIFFYIMTRIAAVRLLRPDGWFDISSDRLLLACYSLAPTSGVSGAYFCAGGTKWSGVVKIGLQRAFGVRCLGISLTDITSFLKSRELIADQKILNAAVRGTRWGGMMIDVAQLTPIFGPAIGLMLKILGYSGLPKSSEDADILDWNEKNWGYHILVPTWFIPDVERAVALLQLQRSGLDIASFARLECSKCTFDRDAPSDHR
jgi:hypothetical protein